MPAAQLHAATAAFSESVIERGRAELTREGVLVRSRRGMHGEITYTLDRERLALFVRQMPNNALSGIKYRSPSFAKSIQQRPRMPNNVFPAEEYDDEEDGDDDDREDDYESACAAGGGWGWIVTALLICGIGGIIFLRRRFASSSIGDPTRTTAMPAFSGTGGSAPARRFDRTPPPAPRQYSTVAPRPSDESIFGPDATVDEDPYPTADLDAHRGFATFPNAFNFVPESGV
ncbi:MAG TPA: hypothetical protein VGI19_11835 [Candidatus Cybelea sp.]